MLCHILAVLQLATLLDCSCQSVVQESRIDSLWHNDLGLPPQMEVVVDSVRVEVGGEVTRCGVTVGR